MRKILLFCVGIMAGSGFGQESGQSVPDGVTELSPPVRPGRRGGVYVTGSTNPYSLGVSNGTAAANAAGGFGSGVRTNFGSGAGYSLVVTNNGVVTTNVVTTNGNAISQGGGISLPPAEIFYPVVPTFPSGGARGNGTTPNGNNASSGTAPGASGSSTVQNPGVIIPPPPIVPPQGTAVAPQGTAVAPQGTPTAPPPASAPRGTPSPPPPLR